MAGHGGVRRFALGAGMLAAVPLAGQAPVPRPVPPAGAKPSPPVQLPALPERIEAIAVARIREEAAVRSRVLETARYLSDVTGPRLTGSPGLRVAQAYVRDRLKEWGLATTRFEPWGPFGRGWALEGFSLSLTAPSFAPLIGYPKAWSPGTPGPLRGEPVLFDPRNAADLERFKGKLKGRIVLFAPPRPVRPLAAGQRLSDSDLLRLANAGPAAPAGPAAEGKGRALDDLKWRMLYGEGPHVVLEPGAGENGLVAVGAAMVLPVPGQPAARTTHPWDLNKPPVLPQVVVAAEHYNRLARLAGTGVPLKLDLQVNVRFIDEEPNSANVVAEIPGGDLKDEFVLLGASLDSWHAGTGAGDSAAATAVAMEAMRILVATGLRPRRSIRLVLWSGGEQGGLGAQAYTLAHFGKRGSLGPEHPRLAACFNLDGGPGRIRGLFLQGNEAVRPVFRAWLAPFSDLGATTLGGGSGPDPGPIDGLGLPAFQFLRDGMDSGLGPSNMDLLERLQEDDLRQSATLAAAFAYFAATRDQKLPRKAPGN